MSRTSGHADDGEGAQPMPGRTACAKNRESRESNGIRRECRRGARRRLSASAMVVAAVAVLLALLGFVGTAVVGVSGSASADPRDVGGGAGREWECEC